MIETNMTSEELILALVERSEMFLKDAQLDIAKISIMQHRLAECVQNKLPLLYSIGDSDAKECKNIYICIDKLHLDHYEEEVFCVLDVINYYTFPVTAILDSITLSNKGKLSTALDIRPFMFSGPAPTQIIWSGSDRKSIETEGYPKLTDDDAKAAFKYWIHYIFGLNLNIDNNTLETV
jgi:hypothetical protein